MREKTILSKKFFNQKMIVPLLLLMAVLTLLIIALPNHAASQNLAMIQMFEPDEAVILPYVFDMIAPAPTLDRSLRNFIFYDYYFYGFPFFGLSGLVLLPLKWMGLLNNTPLVMLILRQMVSVIPTLIALLLLTYMQDRFRTYRSILIFALLLSVPAVLQNNFWWHPDGLILLLAVLVIFFLHRDNLRFGWNFILAAIMCGIATATKLIGVYFFLAVAVTLFAGLVLKKVSIKKLVAMSMLFLLVMGVSFILANPFLLSNWARTEYASTFNLQMDVLSSGYGIVYQKGLVASWPLMHEYYGEILFILTALTVAVWGLMRGARRGLFGLILAWFLPVSVVVLWVTHFKFQYWLPVAIPLFSCLLIAFPEKFNFKESDLKANLARLLVWLIILIQFFLFIRNDITVFNERLHRADNNPRIQFYDQVMTSLEAFDQKQLFIYYDYRMYLPDHEGWRSAINYEPLDYKYIQKKKFDVILLLQQRIKDYLNPNATGIDPTAFSGSQQFYRDAQAGLIQDYHLLFSDDVGQIYIREDLFLASGKP